LRLVNKKSGTFLDSVDFAPTLMKGTWYDHTRADIGFLYEKDNKISKECGWWGLTPEKPSIDLHKIDTYVTRTAETYPHLGDMAQIALKSSYNPNVTEVADLARSKGYGLVASAVCEVAGQVEVAHLIQNPETLDCWLTFEGSDNSNDWLNNIKVFRTDFCGLPQKVHTGFRNQTMTMVLEPSFQTDVRPKLGHCNNVEVLGHSLGGAIAGLFAACAHSPVQPGQQGYLDFQQISFEKKETKLMEFL